MLYPLRLRRFPLLKCDQDVAFTSLRPEKRSGLRRAPRSSSGRILNLCSRFHCHGSGIAWDTFASLTVLREMDCCHDSRSDGMSHACGAFRNLCVAPGRFTPGLEISTQNPRSSICALRALRARSHILGRFAAQTIVPHLSYACRLRRQQRLTGVQPSRVTTEGSRCALPLWPIGLQHPEFPFFFPFPPGPSALGNVKNTAYLITDQTQKSELGREAAPIDPIYLVIMLESPPGGGCGFLSQSA